MIRTMTAAAMIAIGARGNPDQAGVDPPAGDLGGHPGAVRFQGVGVRLAGAAAAARDAEPRDNRPLQVAQSGLDPAVEHRHDDARAPC